MRRGKKTATKEKRRNAKPSSADNLPSQQPDQNQENIRNEYGILPNRDLKKNLGCG
jgi:hypothetical protein